MSVFIRSLLNTSQTIDSVPLPAFALQERGNLTAAIQTAANNRTINVWAGGGDTPPWRSFLEYVPLTGEAIDLPNYAEDVCIAPAGTIATLTLRMPGSATLQPEDGQEVRVNFNQIVTTLTMAIGTGSGHTLRGGLAAGAVNGFAAWRYRAQNKTWYRFG